MCIPVIVQIDIMYLWTVQYSPSYSNNVRKLKERIEVHAVYSNRACIQETHKCLRANVTTDIIE